MFKITVKIFNGAINKQNKIAKYNKKTILQFLFIRGYTIHAIHDGMCNNVTTTPRHERRRHSRGL